MNGTAKDVEASDQFWRAANINVDYWKVYLDARPKYHNGNFYNRILDYNRSHRASPPISPSVAHDVGTGPGQVATVLTEHFDEVVASDLNTTHLNVAEHMLKAKESKSKITLRHAGAEDVAKHFPPYSADLITAAECMPLVNIPVAVSSWADLLKPGGTLAMWFYGRPAFAADDPGFDAAACNAAYEQITNRAFKPFYQVSGPRLANVQKAFETMANWFDNIDLDPTVWTDVRRWKWNSDLPMEFSHVKDLPCPIAKINKIHNGEKVELVDDGELWSERWEIEEWKKFLKVNLPDFQGDWDAPMQEMWQDLEEKMGEKGVKRKIIWPIVCVVATRKGETSASFWP